MTRKSTSRLFRDDDHDRLEYNHYKHVGHNEYDLIGHNHDPRVLDDHAKASVQESIP